MSTWKEIQREYFIQIIIDSEGDIAQMVKTSGLSKATVYNMIRRHNLETDLAIARLSRSKRRREILAGPGGGYQ